MTRDLGNRSGASRVIDAARALGVMSGGPAVLGAWATIGTYAVARALRHRRRPSPTSVLGPAIVLGWLAVRPSTRAWGATPGETVAALPGDEIVAEPGVRMTRAITIEASAAAIWPWLAQIGQDRAGFYSYSTLENLAGCRLRNADRVHDEWQHRAIGDAVPLHPLNALELTRFERARTYALGGWYFNLVPIGEHRTRLIARTRVPRGVPSLVYAVFVEAPHFIMERKMLVNLKVLVERGVADRASLRPGEVVTASA